MTTCDPTLDAPRAMPREEIPACLTRDNLTSPYFPNTSRAMLGAVVVLSGVFLLTSLNRLNHTDLWGHLNFGRWIVENGRLPAADPFAAASTTQPMLHSAWLAQVAGYGVHATFGNEGLVFCHAFLATLITAVLLLAVARRGVPLGWGALAAAAFFVLDLPIVGTIRPQLFGQLGAALTLLLCSELAGEVSRRRLAVLYAATPLLACLWANLHGSVLIGIGLLAIVAAGETVNVLLETTGTVASRLQNTRVRRLWLVVLLAIGGACLNPHGPLLLARSLLFGEHTPLAYITEWQPMRWGSLTGVLLLGSAGIAFAAFKFSPRQRAWHEVAMLVLFAVATLSAIRMLAWWAVVWGWVVVPHLAACWEKFKSSRGIAIAADEPTAMRTLLALSVVFFACVTAPPTYSLVSGKSRGIAAISVKEAPIHVADEVVRRKLAGNVAAPMDWADFLSWQTHGQVKPLVYSHVHLTDRDTWNDYVGIFTGGSEWLTTLRRRNMRYLVIHRQQTPALTKQVVLDDRSAEPGVRILYQDQRSILAEVLPPRKASAAP